MKKNWEKILTGMMIVFFAIAFIMLVAAGAASADTTGPADMTGPVDTDEPADTTGPVDTDEPADTTGPADTDEPADTTGPADTTAPEDTTPPADTTGPADTTAPEDTTPPADTTGPADTNIRYKWYSGALRHKKIYSDGTYDMEDCAESNCVCGRQYN